MFFTNDDTFTGSKAESQGKRCAASLDPGFRRDDEGVLHIQPDSELKPPINLAVVKHGRSAILAGDRQ
jgi:hypothetical protein